jgi:hypothetical protein
MICTDIETGPGSNNFAGDKPVPGRLLFLGLGARLKEILKHEADNPEHEK